MYTSDVWIAHSNLTKTYKVCLKSYISYLEKKRDDMLVALSSDEAEDFVSVPVTLDDGIQMCSINTSMLRDWVAEAVEGQKVPIATTSGDSVEAEVKSIVDSATTAYQQLVGQVELLKLAYSSYTSKPDVTEFITRFRSKFNDVSSDIINELVSFIDSASNGVEVVQNFISVQQQVIDEELNRTDLKVADKSSFTGSAFLAGLVQVGQAIGAFFEGIKFDIDKLGDFFRSILDATVELLAWLAGKLFGNLMTRFEVIDEHKPGLLDLPLVQSIIAYVPNTALDVGDYIQEGILTLLSAAGRIAPTLNYTVSMNDYRWARFGGFDCTSLGAKLNSLNTNIDIPIGQFVIRIARLFTNQYYDKHEIWFQLYHVAEQSAASQSNEYTYSSLIYSDLLNMITYLKRFPIWAPLTSEIRELFFNDDPANVPISYTRSLMSLPVESSTYQLIDSLKQFTPHDANWLSNYAPIASLVIGSLIAFTAGYVRLEEDALFDVCSNENSSFIQNGGSEWWSWCVSESDYEGEVNPNTPEDANGSLLFLPYLHNASYDFVVHYQSTAEAGQELMSVIAKALIAVAISIAAVKLRKKVRQIKLKTRAASLQADDALRAYNNGTGDLATATKAAKKAKRLEKYARLLGVANTSVFSYDEILNDSIESSSLSTPKSFDELNSQVSSLESQYTTMQGVIDTILDDVAKVKSLIQ